VDLATYIGKEGDHCWKNEETMIDIPGIGHHTATVNKIKMHFVEAGAGPTAFLLHGFPETWFAWRKQIPILARHYHLIVPDLRGYGETEKPQAGYDKRTMATDIYELMHHLGIAKVALVGHDRGARVGTRFAKDYRQAIDRLVVLDNIPTRVILHTLNAERARQQWFFLFNQIPDLPEALIGDHVEIWLRHFYRTWSYNPEMMNDQDVAVYVKAYSQPGALRGAFNDYRAGPEDVAQDDADADQLIDVPSWFYGVQILKWWRACLTSWKSGTVWPIPCRESRYHCVDTFLLKNSRKQ
jgi:haloacetate dehalogenase